MTETRDLQKKIKSTNEQIYKLIIRRRIKQLYKTASNFSEREIGCSGNAYNSRESRFISKLEEINNEYLLPLGLSIKIVELEKIES